YGYTNGPTEGFNNKIKVLKRISFGLKNFHRLRKTLAKRLFQILKLKKL
ncbi:MAG: transposase, partial [Tissierellia bacterium]|nr:transposase [Tissierellia bacterium]